jgi:CBS domain-containing protein
MLTGFFKRDVVTVMPHDLVTDAALLMRDHQLGNVVVVRQAHEGAPKYPVGLLTDRDLAMGCVASGGDRVNEMLVNEVMSIEPVCARETDGFYETVQTMRKMGVSRLPVVDEQGALVGIITAKNILALLSDELTEVVEISDVERETSRARAAIRERLGPPSMSSFQR